MQRILLRVLLVYGVLSLIAGVMLGEFALRRGRLPARPGAWERASAVAARHGATLEPVRLRAADGARLVGWRFVHRAGASRPTVIVAHGSSGTRDHATSYAEFLLRAGFDVLAVDARGHGESEGLATYGLLEADDIHRWAALVRDRTPATCVYGLGTSMGAAQLLMAEARQPTFCAVVTDAAFATFLEAGLDRIQRPLLMGDAGRWVGRPAAYAGLAYARLRYGVDLRQAAPASVIGRIRTPILLIHGDADRNTPVYHTLALARAQPRATVWIVPGATHGGVWRAEPEGFPRRIVAFFRKHGSTGRDHG